MITCHVNDYRNLVTVEHHSCQCPVCN